MSAQRGGPDHGEVVPDWLVERLLHDDLPPDQAARVQKRLADEPGGAERLAALRASDQEILAALPPAAVAREVHRRAASAAAIDKARSRAPRRGFALPGLALGAAGLVAMFAVFAVKRGDPSAPFPVAEDGPPEVTRAKGASEGLRPQLLVYRKKADHADRLASGAVVRAADELQLAYVAAGRHFGVIVSVDARGIITPHLPEAPGPAAALDPHGEVALPHAFSLDGPGAERFVLVTAEVPFTTAAVAEALRPGGAPLPKELLTTILTLQKELP